MLRTIFLSVFCSLSLSYGHAQTQVSDTLSTPIEMQQVVVTGTRTPKWLSKSPVLTRVISASDLQKTDATNVKDLLQQVLPGIEFSYAMNQQVHLNFSGFGGQSLLILVDGERLAGETMDDVDFTRLTTDNIDHIEIIKGAASALYGSNATGGVINIITKKHTEPLALNINARWARHNEQRYGGSLQIGKKKWNNLFTIQRNSIDNFNVHNEDYPATRIISTIYGDRVWNFKDAITYNPSLNLTLSGRAGYFFRELIRSIESPERYRDISSGLKASYQPTRNDILELSYSFDQYDKSDYQRITRLDIRDYSNVQNSIRLLFHHTFSNGDILSIGSDYLNDYLYHTHLEGQQRRQQSFDAFAQYDWLLNNKWEIVSALRYDHFSDGAISRLTPKLNLRYQPIQSINLRAGYGMGFRAASLKEKYYNFDMAGIWIIEGNPDLKPETSHNINLSAEYTKGRYNITMSGYYNYIINKIATGLPYYPTPNETMSHLPYLNLNKYEVLGSEIMAQAHWSMGLSARLSYAFTHEQLPRNKEDIPVNNQYIPARKHALSGHIDYDKQIVKHYGFNIAFDFRWLSSVDNNEFVDYYDISKGTNNIHYPAYALCKLSLMQRIGTAIKVNIALDNLFNYKPTYYYLNSPLTDGINLQLGLSVDIDKLF